MLIRVNLSFRLAKSFDNETVILSLKMEFKTRISADSSKNTTKASDQKLFYDS